MCVCVCVCVCDFVCVYVWYVCVSPQSSLVPRPLPVFFNVFAYYNIEKLGVAWGQGCYNWGCVEESIFA